MNPSNPSQWREPLFACKAYQGFEIYYTYFFAEIYCFWHGFVS
uniref:Uncharacterized protein n=1 Tax=Siphoviridae sp. ctjOC2 TaxID=2825632 RepID=A0A8S5Q9G2_9CAUD|nr:MAG TPA: hypothetical protein [Siphoviridae sp. ctjOC2]